MKNNNTLNNELIEAGIIPAKKFESNLSAIETIVNTKISVKPYVEIIIPYLDLLSGKDLEFVIRALTEKGLKNVSKKLISIYRSNQTNKWVLGNAIGVIEDKSTYDEVLNLCKDPSNGESRQMMLTILRKIKTEESFNILLDLLNDETVRGHAICELRKWGEPKALDAIICLEVKKGLYEAKEKKKAIEKLSKLNP